MQTSRPQIDPRARLRPISLVMLNLLILLVAIGAFNFALSLVNLTNHFTSTGIAHTPAAIGTLVITLSSLLLALISGILINRFVRRLNAVVPAQPVSD
jgi:drug/metabolite transporter (DMT)-like permease